MKKNQLNLVYYVNSSYGISINACNSMNTTNATTSPCLYLGQCSSILCDEMAKVSSALSRGSSSNSSSSSSNNSNNSNSIVDVGLYGTKINSAALIDRLVKVIETQDTTTCIHYVCDLGLGSSCSSVLHDIADLLPGISLRSLYISPIDKVHGISAVNSIMNLQASLDTSGTVHKY